MFLKQSCCKLQFLHFINIFLNLVTQHVMTWRHEVSDYIHRRSTLIHFTGTEITSILVCFPFQQNEAIVRSRDWPVANCRKFSWILQSNRRLCREHRTITAIKPRWLAAEANRMALKTWTLSSLSRIVWRTHGRRLMCTVRHPRRALFGQGSARSSVTVSLVMESSS